MRILILALKYKTEAQAGRGMKKQNRLTFNKLSGFLVARGRLELPTLRL